MNESLDFLGLPGIKTTGKTATDETIVVEAETVSPAFPICCLAQDLVSDGYRSNRRTINDTPHGGKALAIMMKVRKAKCRACLKKGMGEVIPHVRDGRHMTQRLFELIAREGLIRTNSSVGRMVHVSEGTARDVVHEFIDENIRKLNRKTPRVLGLDEKMIVKKYRAILGNIEERTILDMLPDRDWALDDYIQAMPNREQVEVICTDMYPPYQKLVSKFLPHVDHVTDRFHVVRRANLAMDKVRSAMMADLPTRDKTKLRNAKKLFGMRATQLEDWAADKIREWGRRYPVLSEAYWTKERYYQMYERCHTPAEAEHYYKHWMKTLPASVRAQFQKHCGIHAMWSTAVFAYFDHPFTTGYVESINRVIDDVNRAGRGYSFEIIRGKMLLAPRLEKKSFRDHNAGMMVLPEFYLPPDVTNLGMDLDVFDGLLNDGELVYPEGLPIMLRKGPATIEALAPEFA